MELYPTDLHAGLLERLNRAIDHARKAPFWSERLKDLPEHAESLEAFRDWPLTAPEDVMETSVESRLAVPQTDVERILASSGGPATAKYFGYTLEDIQCRAISDDFLALDPPREGFLLNITPESWGGGTLLAQMARRAGMTIVSPPLPMLGAFLPVLLRRMRFAAMLSLPSKLPAMIANLKKGGVDPAKLGIGLVMIGGEVASDWLVDHIAVSFGAKVINLYGASDTGGLGNGPGGEILLYRANYYELVDGCIVVTNLDRQASPMIRYTLGDDVDVLEPGVTPRIRVRGRRVDRLCESPEPLWANDVEQVLFSTLNRAVPYCIVDEGDALGLDVADQDAAALAAVQEALAPRLDRPVAVRGVAPEAIEPSPGKFRRIRRPVESADRLPDG